MYVRATSSPRSVQFSSGVAVGWRAGFLCAVLEALARYGAQVQCRIRTYYSARSNHHGCMNESYAIAIAPLRSPTK